MSEEEVPEHFGDIAASMFEEKTITLRVYEWIAVLKALHVAGEQQQSSAFQSIAGVFGRR